MTGSPLPNPLHDNVRVAVALLVEALADARFAPDLPLAFPDLGAPPRDPVLHRAALAIARNDQTRNLFIFGADAAAWDFVNLAVERRGALACTLVDHDPEVLNQQFSDVPLPIARSRWLSLAAAALVLRQRHDLIAPVYRHAEIGPARGNVADLIIVNGPPDRLGGRLGMIAQALTFSRPGTIMLFPALAQAEHTEIVEVLYRHPGLAGPVECGDGGRRSLALIAFEPIRPADLAIPVTTRRSG
jgi:hypothetical protein